MSLRSFGGRVGVVASVGPLSVLVTVFVLLVLKVALAHEGVLVLVQQRCRLLRQSVAEDGDVSLFQFSLTAGNIVGLLLHSQPSLSPPRPL